MNINKILFIIFLLFNFANSVSVTYQIYILNSTVLVKQNTLGTIHLAATEIRKFNTTPQSCIDLNLNIDQNNCVYDIKIYVVGDGQYLPSEQFLFGELGNFSVVNIAATNSDFSKLQGSYVKFFGQFQKNYFLNSMNYNQDIIVSGFEFEMITNFPPITLSNVVTSSFTKSVYVSDCIFTYSRFEFNAASGDNLFFKNCIFNSNQKFSIINFRNTIFNSCSFRSSQDIQISNINRLIINNTNFKDSNPAKLTLNNIETIDIDNMYYGQNYYLSTFLFIDTNKYLNIFNSIIVGNQISTSTSPIFIQSNVYSNVSIVAKNITITNNNNTQINCFLNLNFMGSSNIDSENPSTLLIDSVETTDNFVNFINSNNLSITIQNTSIPTTDYLINGVFNSINSSCDNNIKLIANLTNNNIYQECEQNSSSSSVSSSDSVSSSVSVSSSDSVSSNYQLNNTSSDHFNNSASSSNFEGVYNSRIIIISTIVPVVSITAIITIVLFMLHRRKAIRRNTVRMSNFNPSKDNDTFGPSPPIPNFMDDSSSIATTD